MSPELLQALGWVWCMIGFAWHVRTAPAIVRRPVLGPQPLTVTLERVGGDGVRATGTLEVDPGAESTAVLEALDEVKRSVVAQMGGPIAGPQAVDRRIQIRTGYLAGGAITSARLGGDRSRWDEAGNAIRYDILGRRS